MIRQVKRLARWAIGAAGYTITKKQRTVEKNTSAGCCDSFPESSLAKTNAHNGSEPEVQQGSSFAKAGRDIVSQAVSNYKKAAQTKNDTDLPPYGTRWQPQADAIRAAIDNFSDPVECLHYAQLKITFDHRESGGFVTDLPRIQLYDNLVKQDFPWFAEQLDAMAENPLSYPASLVQYRGRAVSNVLFIHARIVLACSSYIAPPKRILEIGGGYGAPARLWLNNKITEVSSYAIVDIPECLFFAEVALRQEFGNDAVGYFDGTDPGTRIVLVPLCHLGAFRRESDLVVNTGSLQEMTEDWVDYYMKWITAYNAPYFYSLNYAAQPISIMAESRNLWSPRLGPEWTTLHSNMNMSLIRAQGPTNDFLEAVFEKTPARGSLDKWSVYYGHVLSRETYIEGLDLLRQNLNTDDALAFVNIVLERLQYVPKEVLWIVNWLDKNGVKEVAAIRQKLDSMVGGYVHPDPR